MRFAEKALNVWGDTLGLFFRRCLGDSLTAGFIKGIIGDARMT